MQFPMRIGTGRFIAQGLEPEDLGDLYVRGHRGTGGHGEGGELVIRRFDHALGRVIAQGALDTERTLLNFFPGTSGPDDCLPDWERVLHIVDGVPRDVMERQVIAERVYGYVGAPHPQGGAGLDPTGVFVVAFEVPVEYVASVGRHAALMRILNRIKPSHVGGSITRSVARGFLCDDPLSLTDRDVLRA